jgi:hypothetical protein
MVPDVGKTCGEESNRLFHRRAPAGRTADLLARSAEARPAERKLPAVSPN